jgi:hypothetical protein
MSLIIIDYSTEWFTRQGYQQPPLRRGGKFVLLSQDAQAEYLLFSPIQQAGYHANIVAHFSQENTLQGLYNAKRDTFNLEAPNWQIKGGGHWQVDEEAGLLRLYGRSMAYGAIHNLAQFVPALKASAVFKVQDIMVDQAATL